MALFVFIWLQFNSDAVKERLSDSLPSQTLSLNFPESVQQAESADPDQGVVAADEDTAGKALPDDKELPVLQPLKGLYEDTLHGPVPALSPGMTPFNAYSVAYKAQEDVPFVALAFSEFGLSESLSQKMIDVLPPQVSFMLSPYAKDSLNWIRKAREAGHEIWLEIPLRPSVDTGYDPGPRALTLAQPYDQIEDSHSWIMAQGVHYAGVLMSTDGVQALDWDTFGAVLDESNSRGLGVILYGSKTVPDDAGLSGFIKDAGIQLETTEALENALATQSAFVKILRPYDTDLETFAAWVSSLSEKGFDAAPLSAVFRALNAP